MKLNFCDASEVGYGTVTYLRVTNPDQTITYSSVLGKSRNTLVRAPTITRLELQSVVLTVRLNRFIQTEFDLTMVKTFFWIDSTVTLLCINNESKRFKTYVANRLNEIRQHSDQEQWRHCPGKLNPADDCSRGLNAQQYVNNQRWLNGPQFLWLSENTWPETKINNAPDEQLEVRRQKTTLMTDMTPPTVQNLQEVIERYSNSKMLLKSVGWLLKFVQWMTKGKRVSCCRLTTSDVKQAKRSVVSLVQKQTFGRPSQ